MPGWVSYLFNDTSRVVLFIAMISSFTAFAGSAAGWVAGAQSAFQQDQDTGHKDELRALVKTASENLVRLAARKVSSDAEYAQFKADVQAAKDSIVVSFSTAFPDRDPESLFTVAQTPLFAKSTTLITTSIPTIAGRSTHGSTD